MTTYYGHKDWTHYAVSTWINNDKALYGIARSYVRAYRDRGMLPAAFAFHRELLDSGITHTPDGARYTVNTIRATLDNL